MGAYHNTRVGATVKETSAPKQFLSKLANCEDVQAILVKQATIEFLALETGRKVYDLMLKSDAEMDISLSLTQIGLDSLMIIESRRWFRQVLGLQIGVLEIINAESLAQLGVCIADKLKDKLVKTSTTDR